MITKGKDALPRYNAFTIFKTHQDTGRREIVTQQPDITGIYEDGDPYAPGGSLFVKDHSGSRTPAAGLLYVNRNVGAVRRFISEDVTEGRPVDIPRKEMNDVLTVQFDGSGEAGRRNQEIVRKKGGLQ